MVSNKSKTNISPSHPSAHNKGEGAFWADTIATWADAFFGWTDTQLMTNKSKTVTTLINKSKTNA